MTTEEMLYIFRALYSHFSIWIVNHGIDLKKKLCSINAKKLFFWVLHGKGTTHNLERLYECLVYDNSEPQISLLKPIKANIVNLFYL